MPPKSCLPPKLTPGGKKYNCAGAREELADAAQDIDLFRRNVSTEFWNGLGEAQR
jgi:hypothetical protein